MPASMNVLILGASYGSLLATKVLMAGHRAHLICRRAGAELMNAEGAIVRMPIKGREGLVEINSKTLPGTLTASGPDDVDPARFDLGSVDIQRNHITAPTNDSMAMNDSAVFS